MNNDLTIAQAAKLEDIFTIADRAGIDRKYLEPYGNDKAKVSLKIHDEIGSRSDGKLVLVTAITPTKAGEGKSTTTIGLADGLSKTGKKAMACLREPSLGPVFGLKGGATGGESRLTGKGRRLLDCYTRYTAHLRQEATALFDEYFGDEL